MQTMQAQLYHVQAQSPASGETAGKGFTGLEDCWEEPSCWSFIYCFLNNRLSESYS